MYSSDPFSAAHHPPLSLPHHNDKGLGGCDACEEKDKDLEDPLPWRKSTDHATLTSLRPAGSLMAGTWPPEL